MRIQKLVEYWYKHNCPYCDCVNWTYHSHSERHYTGFYLNTDACRCWNCKEEYWLCEPQESEPTVQDGCKDSNIADDERAENDLKAYNEKLANEILRLHLEQIKNQTCSLCSEPATGVGDNVFYCHEHFFQKLDEEVPP